MGEKQPPRLREIVRAAADANDTGKLRGVKQIQFPRIRTKHGGKQRLFALMVRTAQPAPAFRHALPLLAHNVRGDTAAPGQNAHARNGSGEIPEVSAPCGVTAHGKRQEQFPRLTVETRLTTCFLRYPFQFVFQIRLYVFRAFGQTGQAKGPEVDACQQVLLNFPRAASSSSGRLVPQMS